MAGRQEQVEFQSLVAVKVLLAPGAEDQLSQSWFLERARITSSIQHPNVAQILDHGKDGEIFYHVLEWVEGDSLSALRRRVHEREAHLPLGIVLRALSNACEGLHAAHELADEKGRLVGVVHRGLSPGHVLIGTSGAVKIINFGVTERGGSGGEKPSVGTSKSKVAYMAPEQALGRNLDRRADIWSVGAILYQLLSGRTPYDGEDPAAVVQQLLQGNPPAPLPDVPTEVAEIAYTALCYQPEGRFATADEMHIALEAAIARHCGPVSLGHLGSYLEAQLGKRIARRRATIVRAVQTARKRIRIADEYETHSTTDSHPLPAKRRAPAAGARSAPPPPSKLAGSAPPPPSKLAKSEPPPPPSKLARSAAPSADFELKPAPFRSAPMVSDFGDRMEVAAAVKTFGVHRRRWLVLVACAALIGLLAYAVYMVRDRLSLQTTAAEPAGKRR